jgi:hypothetical protein
MLKYIVLPGGQKIKDMTDHVFGRLKVKKLGGWNKGRRLWVCECSCGRVCAVSGKRLRNNHTKSCGCLKAEQVPPSQATHRLTGTPEYICWKAMRSRCYDSKSNGFDRYGARGIKVCPEWKDSFETFLEDMGKRPTKGHSIDRFPNRRGNYEPGNCRWATAKEQRDNQDRKLLTAFGKSLPTTAWTELTGIRGGTIRYRVSRGWAIENALTVKPGVITRWNYDKMKSVVGGTGDSQNANEVKVLS